MIWVDTILVNSEQGEIEPQEYLEKTDLYKHVFFHPY